MPQIITPAINAHRLTGVAPLAITFDALATSIPGLTSLPFSEIQYDWNFGDYANGETWDYGTNPGGNLKNEASGPVAAHVFKNHGTYTVTCKATHRTAAGVLHVGSANLTVTVTDPDVVFAANTIYISQNSTPVAGQNGVPVGATVQQVASWSSVQGLASTYKRILLKRGDVWPNEGGITIGASQAGPGLIGTFGTGNKPVITNGNIRIETTDWRVVDLFFTGASVAERTWSFGLSARAGCVDALFLRTDVRWCFELTSFVGATGVYLVDSVVGLASDQANDARGYANWVATVSRLALMGTRLHGSNAHTARWQGVDTSVASNNTIHEPKGPAAWSMFTIRGKATDGNSALWTGTWTENCVISDNFIESGPPTAYATFSMAPQNNESAERIRNMIVERNRVISLGSEAMIFSVASGLTVRNNILHSLYGNTMSFNASNTAGSPDPSQAFVYNNTLYKSSNTNATSYAAINVVARINGLVVRSNIAYGPTSSPTAMFGGAAVEGTNYTQSNNSSSAQILSNRPWLSATPTAHADYAPSGTYASNSGIYVPVFSDFYGSSLNATRNMGAIRMPSIFVGNPKVNHNNGRALVPITLSDKAPVTINGVLNTSNQSAVAGVDYVGQVAVPFTILRGQKRVVVNIPLIYTPVDLSINAYVEDGYVDDYYADDVSIAISNIFVADDYIDDYFEDDVPVPDLSVNSHIEDDYVDDYVL